MDHLNEKAIDSKIFPELVISIERSFINRFQSDYEDYMKLIVDNFMKMQGEWFYLGNNETTCVYTVLWEDGINFEVTKPEETFRDGNGVKEFREYNSKIAIEYLEKNTLTYDEWFLKYRKEYESYMESVVDSFAMRNSESPYKNIDEILGIDPMVNYSKYYTESESHHVKEFLNSLRTESSVDYLCKNSLTYKEWFDKFIINDKKKKS